MMRWKAGAVAALAQPRARLLHNFATIEATRVALNPYAAATSEALERDCFHGAAPKPACQPRVPDDTSVAE